MFESNLKIFLVSYNTFHYNDVIEHQDYVIARDSEEVKKVINQKHLLVKSINIEEINITNGTIL